AKRRRFIAGRDKRITLQKEWREFFDERVAAAHDTRGAFDDHFRPRRKQFPCFRKRQSLIFDISQKRISMLERFAEFDLIFEIEMRSLRKDEAQESSSLFRRAAGDDFIIRRKRDDGHASDKIARAAKAVVIDKNTFSRRRTDAIFHLAL